MSNPSTATADIAKNFVFRVSVEGMMGWTNYEKLYATESDARTCYEEVIAKAKKEDARVRKGDEHGPNFVRQKVSEFYPNRIESCIFKYWESCGGECEEYDVGQDEIIISRVPVF